MYIPQLNFTRFIAAVSVVVLHFGLINWPIKTDILFPIAIRATSAVCYFFVLSGFILVISSARNEILPFTIKKRSFWINRCARILPLYLFCIILYFALHFEYNPSIPLKWQIHTYIYSAFLLQSWKYQMALDINFPSWTLSVEAFFYFTFPWLYTLFIRFKNNILIYLSIILWLGNIWIYKILIDNTSIPYNFTHFFPLLHLGTFIAGLISGILFIRNYQLLLNKKNWIWLATGIITVFLLFAAYTNMGFWKYQDNILLAPFFILAIYSISISNGISIKILSLKPFVFAGEISYAIYLLQVPVFDFLMQYKYLFTKGEKELPFFCSILVLISIAILSHYIIEKPFRSIIKKWA